jgi:hypothetical protein
MKRRKHCWYQQSDFGWGDARDEHGMLVRVVLRYWIADVRHYESNHKLSEDERAFAKGLKDQLEKGGLPTPEQEQWLLSIARRLSTVRLRSDGTGGTGSYLRPVPL